MDEDRVRGSARKLKGDVKQAAGRALGDTKLESEGAADRMAGKVQNTVGGMKDSLRESDRKDKR